MELSVILSSWIFVFCFATEYLKLTEGANCFKTSITVGYAQKEISTPNYPNPYEPSMTCEWELKANSSISNAVIKVRVLDSHLRTSIPCSNDVISLYDGPQSYYPTLKSWCGTQYPSNVITSTRSSVRVVFVSGTNAHSYRGVKLAFWADVKAQTKEKDLEMTWINYAIIAVFLAIVVVILSGLLVIYAIQGTGPHKIPPYKIPD